MKLTTEQRTILIDALVEDAMLMFNELLPRDRREFINDMFYEGRVGFEQYEDDTLVLCCSQAELHDALDAAGIGWEN